MSPKPTKSTTNVVRQGVASKVPKTKPIVASYVRVGKTNILASPRINTNLTYNSPRPSNDARSMQSGGKTRFILKRPSSKLDQKPPHQKPIVTTKATTDKVLKVVKIRSGA